jgi:hypothetical protein
MEVKIEEGRLHVVLDLEEPHPSSSGKTLLVGGTYGVKRSNAVIDGRSVCIVASAFIYPENQSARALESRGQEGQKRTISRRRTKK